MAEAGGNFREFELDIEKYSKDILPEKMLVFTKHTAMWLGRRLISKSPVDTGMFKGAWIVNLNSPAGEKPKTTDKSGYATMRKLIESIEKAQRGNDIYITNNMEYGPSLEDGHSQQAPLGVVAVSLNETEAMLQATQRTPVENLKGGE